jgi:hypothetical protein
MDIVEPLEALVIIGYNNQLKNPQYDIQGDHLKLYHVNTVVEVLAVYFLKLRLTDLCIYLEQCVFCDLSSEMH